MEPITDPREAGKFLKAKIKERGLLIKDVADRVSADPSYMSHLLSGRVSIVDSEYFGPLVKELALSVEEVRRLNPAAVIEVAAPEPRVSRSGGMGAGLRHHDEVLPVPDLHRVAVRGMAAAGPAFYSDDNIIGYEYVTDDNYRPGMLSVEIDGDSMEPTIPNGSRVYIDSRELEPRDGKMYLIHITGDGLVVKRAKKVSGNWFLMSDNPKYQAFTPDDATIIGEVYFIQPRGWRA